MNLESGSNSVRDRSQSALVILRILVHAPNVEAVLSRKNVLGGQHRRHHGVVLVVVFVHAVAADQMDPLAMRSKRRADRLDVLW